MPSIGGNFVPVEFPVSVFLVCFQPSIYGGVPISEPADSRQFVLLASGAQVHDHVVFRDHQLQSPDDKPDERRENLFRFQGPSPTLRTPQAQLINCAVWTFDA